MQRTRSIALVTPGTLEVLQHQRLNFTTVRAIRPKTRGIIARYHRHQSDLAMTQDELKQEHGRLYKEASAAIYPLIEIHGEPRAKLTIADESELHRALSLFDRVLSINPGNWSAMWMVGKVHQRLQDFKNALEWFARGHAINPNNPDLPREAAIAAMELGRPADAIPFCLRAIKINPDDAGLRANLALALLFTGDATRATAIAQEASKGDPTDEITARIVNICADVLSGKRQCPRHVRDL